MNIAIIDMDELKNPFWGAGQARATREVGKRLAKNHTVTVYCTKYPGYKDYQEDSVTYKHVGLECQNAQLTNAVFILNIPFLVRKFKADIIVENFNAPISIGFSPLFTKIPVIGLPTMFHAEAFAKKYHLPFHWIEKFGLRFYKYFLPFTENDKIKMEKHNKKVVSKIIPEGVSDEYFIIQKSSPKHILYVGRFDVSQKGLDILLEAYAKIKNDIKYPLIVAGFGPDERQIKSLIKKFNLEDKVILKGPAYGKEKEKLLAESLFIAMPSRFEGFSLFALEAMASGNPIVCFDIPGFSWMSENVSFKAKSFDIADYADLLLKAASNKTLLTEKSNNAREFAKKFSWDNVALAFESFFEEILVPSGLRSFDNFPTKPGVRLRFNSQR